MPVGVAAEPKQRQAIVAAAEEAGILRSDIVDVGTRGEAVRAIDAGPFDLAVIDLRLIPGEEDITDGIAVIKRMKEAHPDCIIIALTAGRDIGIKPIEAVARDFLTTADMGEGFWQRYLAARLRLWKGVWERVAASVV